MIDRVKRNALFETLLALCCCFVIIIWFRESAWLAASGVLGLVIMFLLVSRIQIAFFLLIFFMPLQRSVFANYGFALSWFPVVILSVALLLFLLKNLHKIRFSEWLPQLILLLLLIYIIVTLWVDASIRNDGAVLVNPLKGGGVAHFRYILQTLLFFWIISFLISTRRRLDVVVKALVLTLACVSLVGISDLLAWLMTGSSYIWRLFLHFDPQALSRAQQADFKLASIFRGWVGNFQFGNFLVISGLIVFPYLFAKRKGRLAKVILIAFLILCSVCLYFTYSVGSWLAALVGIVALQLVLLKGKRPLLLGIGTAVVLVLVIIYIWPSALEVLPNDPQKKALDFANLIFKFENPQSRPVRIRIDLIRVGLRMFLQNPIFGKGFATYARYALQSNLAGVYEIDLPYSHNSYIIILSELGLVGFALFCLLMGHTMRKGFSNIRILQDEPLRCLQIGTLAALFANLVFLVIYETWLYNLNLWLVLGLTSAIGQVIAHEAEG